MVYEDANDWIDANYTICNIEQITMKNMSELVNCVTRLDDMGDKLNRKIIPFFPLLHRRQKI